MSFSFSPGDRLLIVAPHPDDESLATGGLIQRMVACGADARVLMVTNGDNNPWPQRWQERRWRIGPGERQRWGAMRCKEALAALAKLGFQGRTDFLGYPDQGLTDLLLQADPAALDCFRSALSEWRPNHIVFPSSYDLHPDHNALHVLVRIALLRSGLGGVAQSHFAVHGHHLERIPAPAPLHLGETERRLKTEAILCHESQMVLSRKRFLAYSQPDELYFNPAAPEVLTPGLPVTEAYLHAGALNLAVALPFLPLNRGELWIAGESATAGSFRWRLPIPARSGKVRLQNRITGKWERQASVRTGGGAAQVSIPISGQEPLDLLFVKAHRRTVFLDHAGWQEVPLRERD